MIKVLNGRNQIKRLFLLRARIKRLQVIETGMAQDALTHLKTHGTLKQENWAAMINKLETRRPKWKEEFVQECGIDKATQIIANTKPSICEKVEVYRDGVKVTC